MRFAYHTRGTHVTPVVVPSCIHQMVSLPLLYPWTNSDNLCNARTITNCGLHKFCRDRWPTIVRSHQCDVTHGLRYKEKRKKLKVINTWWWDRSLRVSRSGHARVKRKRIVADRCPKTIANFVGSRQESLTSGWSIVACVFQAVTCTRMIGWSRRWKNISVQDWRCCRLEVLPGNYWWISIVTVDCCSQSPHQVLWPRVALLRKVT